MYNRLVQQVQAVNTAPSRGQKDSAMSSSLAATDDRVPVAVTPQPPPLHARCPICSAPLPEGARCTPLCQLAIELERRADAAQEMGNQCVDIKMRYLYMGKEEGLRDGAREAGRKARLTRPTRPESGSAVLTVFDLIESVAKGASEAALRQAAELTAHPSTDASTVLHFLARYMRQLLLVSDATDREQAIRLVGLPPFIVDRLLARAKRLTPERIVALKAAIETTSPDGLDALIEMLCAEMLCVKEVGHA